MIQRYELSDEVKRLFEQPFQRACAEAGLPKGTPEVGVDRAKGLLLCTLTSDAELTVNDELDRLRELVAIKDQVIDDLTQQLADLRNPPPPVPQETATEAVGQPDPPSPAA